MGFSWLIFPFEAVNLKSGSETWVNAKRPEKPQQMPIRIN